MIFLQLCTASVLIEHRLLFASISPALQTSFYCVWGGGFSQDSYPAFQPVIATETTSGFTNSVCSPYFHPDVMEEITSVPRIPVSPSVRLSSQIQLNSYAAEAKRNETLLAL